MLFERNIRRELRERERSTGVQRWSVKGKTGTGIGSRWVSTMDHVVEKCAQALMVECSPPGYECLENNVDSNPIRHKPMALSEDVKEPEEFADTSAVPRNWTDKDTVQKHVAQDCSTFRVYLACNPIKGGPCSISSPIEDQTLKSSVQQWATVCWILG